MAKSAKLPNKPSGKKEVPVLGKQPENSLSKKLKKVEALIEKEEDALDTVNPVIEEAPAVAPWEDTPSTDDSLVPRVPTIVSKPPQIPAKPQAAPVKAQTTAKGRLTLSSVLSNLKQEEPAPKPAFDITKYLK